MQPVPSHGGMQECIEQCLRCYRVCMEMAMMYCLEAGGKHSEPHHVRLIINCAGMCRTTAEFMMSNLELHRPVCAVCAEVCEVCAESCEEVGDAESYAAACRLCAESCRRQASSTPSEQMISATVVNRQAYGNERNPA